jgi:hypothetical protein
MNNTQNWYIVKQANEQCEIISNQDIEKLTPDLRQRWGPFETQQEAIASRVGLIRAGKCQPK